MADQASLAGEVFYPSVDVLSQALLQDWEATAKLAEKDLEGFWAKEAEELEWYRKWDRVLDDSQQPFFKWFVGAQVNIVHNCLDRHMKTWRKNKLALIWVGEQGDVRTYSYYALNREVCQFASVLRAMGINKGDRVTIYMPRIPEIIIAMLACAKVGAIHSVVYGGFSVDSLQGRIEDSHSKVVVTADGGYMNGKTVELKKTVDEALRRCPSVESVIVVQRTNQPISMEAGRDYWYHELLRLPIVNRSCPTEVMDAEDPLYILYTSGTTGKPKGVVHATGGYLVGVNYLSKAFYQIQERDIYWSTSDIGWIVGHSFIVYGPLSIGATVLCREGAPDYPSPEVTWELCERFGVNVMFTAPTAVRMWMSHGAEAPGKFDLSKLRLLACAGEPLNPEAHRWAQQHLVGQGNGQVVDNWWQTEIAGPVIGTLPTFEARPGKAGKPFVVLTGGEPLLRRDVEELVGRLAGLGEIDLTLTTNAALLAQKAEKLAGAGLTRVTVSLDSLDDATFRALNDVDFPVQKVLEGIDAAVDRLAAQMAFPGMSPLAGLAADDPLDMRSYLLERFAPTRHYNYFVVLLKGEPQRATEQELIVDDEQARRNPGRRARGPRRARPARARCAAGRGDNGP